MSTARVFILEDDSMRVTKFIEAGIGLDLTIAKDKPTALRKFTPPYDYLFLDHDLGERVFVSSDDDNTGAAFCRWLGKAPDRVQPTVIVHSYNPDGAKEMIRLLRDNGWENVLRIPFGLTVLGILRSIVAEYSET